MQFLPESSYGCERRVGNKWHWEYTCRSKLTTCHAQLQSHEFRWVSVTNFCILQQNSQNYHGLILLVLSYFASIIKGTISDHQFQTSLFPTPWFFGIFRKNLTVITYLYNNSLRNCIFLERETTLLFNSSFLHLFISSSTTLHFWQRPLNLVHKALLGSAWLFAECYK